MSGKVFSGVDIQLGIGIAPIEITQGVEHEFTYRSALLQEGGVSADTFMEFAGRFALLCDQTYQCSVLTLTVDAAHPNITIECDELHEILRKNPGDVIPTPADAELFRQLFAVASTADLVIKPVADIPELPSTFAKVSWERSAGGLIEFYAQGGCSTAGTGFQRDLYQRMFYVPESAPRKGLDVALGISAVTKLRRYGVGSKQYTRELRERFDFASRHLGRPDSDYYLGSDKESSKKFVGWIRRILGK